MDHHRHYHPLWVLIHLCSEYSRAFDCFPIPASKSILVTGSVPLPKNAIRWFWSLPISIYWRMHPHQGRLSVSVRGGNATLWEEEEEEAVPWMMRLHSWKRCTNVMSGETKAPGRLSCHLVWSSNDPSSSVASHLWSWLCGTFVILEWFYEMWIIWMDKSDRHSWMGKWKMSYNALRME